MAHEYNNLCVKCGDHVLTARWKLGYKTCLRCGEKQAKQVSMGFCVAPMHKSNYILVTNLDDLKGLNNKGGLVK